MSITSNLVVLLVFFTQGRSLPLDQSYLLDLQCLVEADLAEMVACQEAAGVHYLPCPVLFFNSQGELQEERSSDSPRFLPFMFTHFPLPLPLPLPLPPFSGHLGSSSNSKT